MHIWYSYMRSIIPAELDTVFCHSIRSQSLCIVPYASQVVMAFSIVFILLSTAALILNTVPCLLDGPTCNASSSGAPATSGDGSAAQPPSQALARNRSITPRPGLGVHNTTANPEHDSDFEDNEHIVFAATEAICVGMPAFDSSLLDSTRLDAHRYCTQTVLYVPLQCLLQYRTSKNRKSFRFDSLRTRSSESAREVLCKTRSRRQTR